MSLDAARELESECGITKNVVIKEETMEVDVVEVPVQVFQTDVVEAEFERPLVKEEPCLGNEGFSEAGLHAECLSPGIMLEIKLEPECEAKDEKMPVLEYVQQFDTDLSSVPKEREALRPTMDTKRVIEINTTVTLSPELNIVQTSEGLCLCKICKKPATERSQLCSGCESEQAIKILSKICKNRNAFNTLKQNKSDTKLTENLNPVKRERSARCEAAEEALGLHTNCKTCKAKLNGALELCQACEAKKAPPLCNTANLNLNLNCWVQLERCEAAEEALRLKLDALVDELYAVKKRRTTRRELKTNIKNQTETESERSKCCKMCKNEHTGVHQFCEVCEKMEAAKQLQTIRNRRCGKQYTSDSCKNLWNHEGHIPPNVTLKQETLTNLRLGCYNSVSCDECDSTFTSKRRLTIHKNTHSYTCKTCSVKFKTLASLREHEKIHLKEHGRYRRCRP